MSAHCVAGLALAAIVAGCGGGHKVAQATSTAEARSSTSASAASKPSYPATPPTTTATRATPSPDSFWPYAKTVASLAGRTVTVSGTTVQLDPSLLECNGEGPALESGPTRAWSRYTCTQTLFKGGVDHDVTFDVVIVSATQLRIQFPRNGPE